MAGGTPLSLILASKSGGGGGADNAVLYVAQTLTAPQQAQARANIGAISADDIGTVFTIKGSVATVADLPSTDNSIGDVYYVEAVSAGYVWITSTTYPNGYWEELGEPIDLSGYEEKPTVVADSVSTSITLASAADNTIYEYGELTALTVTAISNPGSFIIQFTSGDTATTTNFPASMVFPEAFAAEVNTRYEINCVNGYALVAGWPTT